MNRTFSYSINTFRNRRTTQGMVHHRSAIRHALAGLVLACASAPLAAQAPLAQSSFAQYLSSLAVGVGILATSGKTGDGGPASAALLNAPASLAYDAAGNLYICDSGSNLVRKVDTSGNISTVAGTTSGFSGDGGPATQAQLAAPSGVFVDAAGNIYIADTTNNRIRKVDAVTHVITTIIGNAGTVLTKDGVTGTKTQMNLPKSVWVDPLGDVFYAGNNYLRVLVANGANAGLVYSVAGTNVSTSTGDGGPALSATFNGPRYGGLNSRGDYFIVDKVDNVARIVPATPFGTMLAGNIYDLAGVSGTAGYAGDGSTATSATLSAPNSVVTDAFGNAFIPDATNNVVRAVDKTNGNISTMVFILANGAMTTATSFLTPASIAYSPTGTVAIADLGKNNVRLGTFNTSFPTTAVASSSVSTTFKLRVNFADSLNAPVLTPGAPADFTLAAGGTCVAGAAALNSSCTIPVTFNPTAPGLRVSQLITTETATGLKAVLPVTGIGTAPAVAITPRLLTTFAGTPGQAGSTGNALTSPSGMAFDAAGNLYVSGADNTVRIISPSGTTITPFVGTGTAGYTGDGGTSTAATLSNPAGLAIDPSGNLLIADTGNNAIREVSAEGGIINTITFTNQSANITTATGSNTLLNAPKGVATDSIGNIYIADTGNNVVRKLVRGSGAYITLAGTVGTAGYSGDNNVATNALLSSPSALAVDMNGNIFIADTGNKVVREISATTGNITTVAGSVTATTPGDGGLATAAGLVAPSRIAVDAAGDLFIADAGSNSVRYVNAASGIIITLAGSGTNSPVAGDGGPATDATLNAPTGLAVDALDNVYIGDTGNSRIAVVAATTTTLDLGGAEQGTTSAVTSATITNFGNAPLTISNVSVGGQFTQSLTTGNDCTSSTTLAPGASCLLGVVFSPTATGAISGTATITDNALNVAGTTQTITLTGKGTSAPAAIAVASGNNQTVTPIGPFQPISAKVVDSVGTPVSGATVTFTVPSSGATGTFSNGSNTVQELTVASGIATANLTAGLTRGTFSVTATVPPVVTPATFSETISGNPSPTLTIAYLPATNPATYGTPLTLAVTLTPATLSGNNVSGTITFSDNGAAIGTATVSSGKASTIVLPNAGTQSYTASYAGDTNFSASTTATPATLSVNPFGITGTASSVSFVFGAPLPTITGTLSGVLPADVANVVPTFFGVTTPGGTTPVVNMTAVGIYPIGATLSGSAAANYKVTAVSGTVTITQASTTSVLTYGPYNSGASTKITLTDAVKSSTTGMPDGTVTFTDVGPSGTVSLTPSKTTGAFTYAGTFALGTHVITASYSGSANFGPSVSTTTITIVNPAFTMTQTASSVSVGQGEVADMGFSYGAVGGLITEIDFTCSGLPANASCTVNPPSFTPGGTLAASTGNGLVEIQTAGPGLGYTASVKRPAGMNGERKALYTALCSLPGFAFLLLSFRRGKKMRRKFAAHVLLLLLSIGALLQMTGCGGNLAAPLVAQTTPVGSSTITVTATSAVTNTVVSSFTFTLNVTKAP
jgi:sugar lactone lactonase YvrE